MNWILNLNGTALMFAAIVTCLLGALLGMALYDQQDPRK